MPDFPTIILCPIICLMPVPEQPVVIDTFAQNCTVRGISKQDTPQSQRDRAQDNARCRAAKGAKK